MKLIFDNGQNYWIAKKLFNFLTIVVENATYCIFAFHDKRKTHCMDKKNNVFMFLPWGWDLRGSLDTNVYLKAKLKMSVFESGHLIFDKKTFFSEKFFFYPNKIRTLFFWKKKHFFFFLKMFFGKNFWQIFDKFFVGAKVLKILKNNFSRKHFQQKKIFFSKKGKCFFFKKTKVLGT